MPWRDLPPHLRHRVHTPDVLGSLVALVATPVFAVLWLVGPIGLAVLFYARDQHVLAALCVPLALFWVVQIIRDPTVLGLLFATPYAAWSLMQQWRGKVDTEDLEDGRYVGLAEWRAPTPREREVLERLAATQPDLPQIRAQIATAEVRAECVCGCPSILLYPTAPGIPREAGRDELEIAADLPDGGRAVLRLHLGNVRELRLGHHDGRADEAPGT